MDPITLLIFVAGPLLMLLVSSFMQQRGTATSGSSRPQSFGAIMKALGPVGTGVRDYRATLGQVDNDKKRQLLIQGLQSDPAQGAEARSALTEYLGLQTSASEQAALYLILGNRHYEAEEMDEAEKSYRQAMAAAEEAEEPRIKSTALGNLGVLLSQENPKRARQNLEEALALDRGLGNRAGMVNNLAALARLYQDQGDSSRALTMAQQAEETQAALNVSQHWADALGNLALAYRAQADLENAQTCLEQSLQIQRDLGSLAGEAACLDNLGFVYQERVDLARALQLHQQARALFEFAGAHAQAEVTRQRVAALKRQLEASSS